MRTRRITVRGEDAGATRKTTCTTTRDKVAGLTMPSKKARRAAGVRKTTTSVSAGRGLATRTVDRPASAAHEALILLKADAVQWIDARNLSGRINAPSPTAPVSVRRDRYR